MNYLQDFLAKKMNDANIAGLGNIGNTVSGIISSVSSAAGNVAGNDKAQIDADVQVSTGNTKVHARAHHEINNWDKPFIRSVFSDDNGGGSTSRISAFVVIMFTVFWVTYLVLKTVKVPEHLITLGMFSAMLTGVIYYPAKFVQIFTTYFGRKK